MIAVSADNGRAPTDALTVLPGSNGDGSAHTAPHVTAASYARLRSAMLAAGLGDLVPSDGWSCYRDRAAQQHMRDIGLTTIPVGQSIHGEWEVGSAVDFSGLGGFGAPRHQWLVEHGGPYGWYQPGWATALGSLPEPWHWEYDTRNDTHAGEDDDDMTPEQANQLTQAQTDSYEARRILAVMVTGNGAGTPAEANYVNQSRELKRDTEEIRRMAGVTLGWQPPTPNSPEVGALAKLWGQATSTFTRGADLLVFAIVVLLALVAGVAVGLLADTREGVVAGVAVVAGGLLVTVLSNLPRGSD